MGDLNIVLFFALLATCWAHVAEFSACDEGSDDICKVTSLDITPCKNKNKCVIRKNTDASLSFDYTPSFEASNLESDIFWDSPTGDVPFAAMERNGCTLTTCPLSPGKSQTLNYRLHMGKKLPNGIYKLKLKLANKDNSTQFCCLKTTIKITP